MAQLGVNIDHVATVRQARRTNEPDPVWAATLAQLGGADGITVHLREDRRHIQDRDLLVLRETVTVKLNLELASNAAIVAIATQTKPDQATLVPEKRNELTTEGGLDLRTHRKSIVNTIGRLQSAGIIVSLFLDPSPQQIELAAELGADAVELHTGTYAAGGNEEKQQANLAQLNEAAALVRSAGLTLHAGHGLTYRNARPIAAIEGMSELNIGHSIVARAIMVGFEQAVREMKTLIA